ncbi:MAG: TetR/AcrR family transcriptional regulator [Acidimicrobiales bacterium]|nr:TetR/AcrR family transcriptional regulator [Acidimicrobiales bacterium]
MATARPIFATFGYDATTNKEVAAAAGITTGAIYHYFDAKADLFVAVFEEVQDTVFGAFEEAVAPHEGFLDRLIAMLDCAVRLNTLDASIAGFLVSVPAEVQRHPELATRVGPLNRAGPFFEWLVVGAEARGELAEGVEPSTVVDMILALTAGLARFANEAGNPERHARATEAMKRLILGTLVSSEPGPAPPDGRVGRRTRTAGAR